jgi:hypothetical protein
MKKVLIIFFVGVLMAASAFGDALNLASSSAGGQNAPNYTSWGMILWTSPGNGSVTLSGGAMATQSTDDVWLYYFPASVFAQVTPPVNPPNVNTRSGATEIATGTISGSGSCSGFVDYGTANCIPLRQVTSLGGVPVQTGDVIAALIENMNLYTNDSATLDMNAQFSGDFQGTGSGGTQSLNGSYLGISGSLDPSAGHSVDTYAFDCTASGDLSGAALTDLVWGNGSSGGGFQSGMGLALYDASGDLVGSTTVLGSSTTSSTFDFGYQAAGNYELQLTDLNSTDDPPYEIEFNSPLGAPLSSSPEPNSAALLGALVGVLAVWRLAGHSRRKA